MFICAEVRVPRVLALFTRFWKASDIPTSSMAFPAWAILLKRYTPAIIPICSCATGATAVKFQMHIPERESSNLEKFRINFSEDLMPPSV